MEEKEGRDERMMEGRGESGGGEMRMGIEEKRKYMRIHPCNQQKKGKNLT